MKNIIILVFSILSIPLNAQYRFFTLTEGWRVSDVEETEQGYLSLGLKVIDGGAGIDHSYLSSRIDENGQIVDFTETILDTANIISFQDGDNKIITVDNYKIVAGMKKYAEYRFYGLLIWFNEDLSEVDHYRTYDMGWNARFTTINHPNDSTILVAGVKNTSNTNQ